MRRIKRTRSNQKGAGLYLFILVLLFISPVILTMIKGSISQNKNALRDRNIKTSREMAESIGVDFMNSFSEDWHRDSFDQFYLAHNFPSFAGLGSASSRLDVQRSSGTILIRSTASYDRGGTIPLNVRTTKGVESMCYWSSDALKFDFVWNVSATIGGNVDQNITSPGTLGGTHFINGDFDAGSSPVTINGLWIVKGTFRIRAPVLLGNPLIHCRSFVDENGRSFPNATIRTYPLDAFVPNVKVIPPEGNSPAGDLSYYDQRRSTGITLSVGNSLQIHLNSTDTLTTIELDGAGVPGPTVDRPYFPTAVPDNGPWTLVVNGGNVELLTSVISRPITLVVRGGNVTVTGNVSYLASPTATANRTFALITDGNIALGPAGAGDLNLVGFFGTVGGFIRLQGLQNIQLNGTLYGLIGAYGLGANTLTVTADRQLARFPPPKIPRRPRLVWWDYNNIDLSSN